MSIQAEALIAPPSGALPFNPYDIIGLPSPAAGDTTIFSFKVPIGYDGVLLGHFHVFTGGGFIEGSGDLAWRIAVNDPSPRFLRDCGDMLVTIGRIAFYQTIPGGLQLRSGNVVSYIVNAPNTTGSLPAPGTPSIIAGMHGYFYPRR